MLSNLFAIIATTIVLSFVGTYVIENIIVKKIGRYKLSEEELSSETKEIKLDVMEIEEQKRLEQELNERRGLKYACITFLLVIILIGYMIFPGLPGSGLLLDNTQFAYIDKLFGDNSFFQSGFTVLVSFVFVATGIAYAIGAKSIKNDKDMVDKATVYLKNVGYVIALLFFASNMIAVFKETKIGELLVAILANLLKEIQFTGFPLILVVLLAIAFSGIFVTSTTIKWSMLSPVVVPLMMQANISPQFTQFIYRAGDSMTKGITPLLAYFVIYLAYMNIYNKDDEPITISKAISFITPYWMIISLTWIFILLFFYMLRIPIGPSVLPGL
jgi:aminobenzoyl-glutamate transport protein